MTYLGKTQRIVLLLTIFVVLLTSCKGSVETSENNQTVNITLSDGSIISLPMTNKILNLLYGEWKKFDFSDGYNYGDYIVFEEDGTAKMSSGDYDEDWMVGKFRFIPDKYITCIFEYDESLIEKIIEYCIQKKIDKQKSEESK